MWLELLNNSIWIESICRLKGLSIKTVKTELEEFLKTQILSGEIKRGEKELKKH